MCGIGASLDLRGEGRVVKWALPSLRHRGPDGIGDLVDRVEGLSLEHCRLAIIDPENRDADQPFSDETGRWTIVYNGELFNYRDLRTDLKRRGVRFRTLSDTEVVLASLIADGESALERFRGMFAFVLWDAQERQILAARDQIGVKPLYYTVADGMFVAASELRTLVAHPSVRPILDPAGVVEYLAFGFVSGGRTFLDGVRKLPPGHALRVRRGELEVFEYWDALSAARHDGSDPQEELAHRLDDAVAASLVSDVPVSLMLSGGLDSSAIAALAARHVPPADLTAYSVSFGLPTDESDTAARLAADLGMRHRELRLTEHELAGDFDEWLRRVDVPSANPTWIAVSCIAKAVHNDGIKVLLSGDGADELFGGYNRWMTYLRFHDLVWSRTPNALRRVGGRIVRPVTRGLAGDFARRATQGGQLFVGSRPFHDDDLARCLGPVGRQAASAIPPESYVDRIRTQFDERLPGGDQLAWMSYLALKSDLVEDYLVRLDTMGMGESVEGRVPLLDPDLVRFAFSLSQGVKLGGGYEQKALFRRVVSTFVPSYITERPKQGFCPPVADWASALLRSRVRGHSRLIDEGLVAPDAIERLSSDGAVGASFALWGLGTLMIWCDTNL